MAELIRELLPNRNEKYYLLLVSYITILNRDHNPKVRLTVGEIIEQQPMTEEKRCYPEG
jgi:hypothetical protein